MEISKSEFVKTLFNVNLINNVFEQKKAQHSNLTFDYNGFKYFLHLSDIGNVNLSIAMKNKYGDYIKTIGFYVFNDGALSNIFILKEFETPYEEIKSTLNPSLTDIVKYLTPEENGYISVCSKEVKYKIEEMFNSPLYNSNNHLSVNRFQIEDMVINGLNIQLRTSMMGALEASVNEIEDGYDDVLVMFNKSGTDVTIHCLDETYYRLQEMRLLSILI